MMKKLVTFMLAVVMVATLLPTQAFADDVIKYDYVHPDKGAYADEGYERRLEQNKKWLEIERTDEYALDFYSIDFDFYNRIHFIHFTHIPCYLNRTIAIIKI